VLRVAFNSPWRGERTALGEACCSSLDAMSASVGNIASSSSGAAAAAASTPTMNWEPIRKRLVSEDVAEALQAATELRNNLEIVHTAEFPLMLSALLPAFTAVILASSDRTLPSPDVSSPQHKVRNVILDMIHKMPTNEVLHPHAPHLVALALDVLRRDYEDNSLLASKIIFDLYKAYRSLPQEHVQPYFDLVVAAYLNLPSALATNFSLATMRPPNPPPSPSTPAVENRAVEPAPPPEAAAAGASSAMEVDEEPAEDGSGGDNQQQPSASHGEKMDVDQPPAVTASASAESAATLASSSSHSSSSPPILALRSNLSLRVLTESPLIVMLMLQLYPSFLKTNIPVLIKVMMEALVLRAPPLQSVVSSSSAFSMPSTASSSATPTTPTTAASSPATPAAVRIDPAVKRIYYSRSQQLVAAQAKTLSFVTYLLRSFAAELKPYEERLASSVVSLMAVCPRESLSTRKELLVATRHVLNSEFRRGFYRHADSMLDERVLLGSGSTSYFHRFSDQALLRPLAYTTLSDYVQHARAIFTMKHMSRVVLIFSRVLHDSSGCILPMSTQYTAVRTLLSLVDLIFQNKDPNPQLGRDLLVRMLRTLVDKLEALVEYYPTVLELEEKRTAAGDAVTWMTTNHGSSTLVESIHSSTSVLSGAPPDSTRDVQIMVRAIMMGNKTLITCLHGYRAQREKVNRASHDAAASAQAPKLAPQGPNDEVASAMSRLTHTEVAIIDRYIMVAFKAATLLKDNGQPATTTTTTIVAPATPTSALGSTTAAESKATSGGDRSMPEHHRDSLTQFAAAFSTMDGIDLARTLGRRLGVLVDAMIEDPIVMVVPRHLLGTSATISFEFCTLLLDHIVGRMDELACGRDQAAIFLDAPGQCPEKESLHKGSIQRNVELRLSDRPASDEEEKSKSTALLQLFERILKSLSSFPGNESIVRRHLRRIVVVCLRSSMEDARGWPDNYCMLLRYIFRSISAGKFEDSYKELLPLIPAVLNGLYRVMTCSKDTVIRYTAIELCLTIPARLSSLLPHMNLLLRVIIPALESNSGDLVNLGLRTLEFWVDNLNPLFLVPEISKQTEVFTSLMQALSRHLRPAPYPYGLLTLRLLGKLGGRNRQFLREPFAPHEASRTIPDEEATLPLSCCWNAPYSAALNTEKAFGLPLPLDRCVSVLRMIATASNSLCRSIDPDSRSEEQAPLASWHVESLLDMTEIDRLDLSEYQRVAMLKAKQDQASACVTILHTAATQFAGNKVERNGDDVFKTLLLGLMYASMVDESGDESLELLKSMASAKHGSALRCSLTDFLLEPDRRALSVATAVIQELVNSKDDDASAIDVFLGLLLRDFCRKCATCEWGERTSLYGAIHFVLSLTKVDLRYKSELKVMTTAFVSVKSVPQELSMACAAALRFFCGVCVRLYGKPWTDVGSERPTIWDSLEMGAHDKGPTVPESVEVVSQIHRPCDEVFRVALVEIASSHELVR
jgi:transformation/transcription domain-associated protein